MAIAVGHPSFSFEPNWQPAEEGEKEYFFATDWGNTYSRTESISIDTLKMTFTVMRGDTDRRYHTEKSNKKYYFNGQEISFKEAREKFDQAWDYLRENNMLGDKAISRLGLKSHRYYFDKNLIFIKAE